MNRLGFAACAAALALSACAHSAVPAGSAPAASSAPAIDPLSARIDAEIAYDAGVVGLEISLQQGALKSADLPNARLGLVGSHAAIVAARTAADANGVPTSAELTALQKASDADYARVLGEMGG